MQWSYATVLDWFLLLIATTAAIVHGGALPAFTIVFGDFIDLFLDQGRTQEVGRQITSALSTATGLVLDARDLDCESPDPFNVSAIMGVLPLTIILRFDLVGQPDPTFFPVIINGTSDWSTIFDSIGSTCLDNVALIEGINEFVFIFIGLAVGVFTFGYLEISFFQTACERQVKKIRLAFYKAILRQEVGWFDANPSGELASRIAE